MADVGRMQIEGLLDHGIALGRIGLGLDFLRQLIHLGIAVRTQVELARALVIHAGHQCIESVVGIVGGGRPAQHVEAGVAAQHLGK